MPKEFLNPPDLPDWSRSFSQVVAVSGGAARMVFVAGQVAVDAEKKLVGGNDLARQAGQAFANLARALAAGGAAPADVVRLNIYVKNLKEADAPLIRDAMRRVFPHENLPASTWLGVPALAEEGFLIEVDAIAAIE